MKSLIKITAIIIIIVLLGVYLILSIWGSDLVETLGSRILASEVRVERCKFVPWRLALNMEEIALPEWQVIIPAGTLYLVPFRLDLAGVKLAEKLIIDEDNFKVCITKSKKWDLDLSFREINLDSSLLSAICSQAQAYGLKRGVVGGTVKGFYSPKEEKCYLACLVCFDNLTYEEPDTLETDSFLGITPEQLAGIIETNNGTIEIDFTYNGPLDEFNQIYRYRPGRKTIALIAQHIIRKRLSF